MSILAPMVTSEDRVTCPACDSSKTEALAKWRLSGDHQAMACWACGLLFSHPQPPAEILDAYYSPDGGCGSDSRATQAAAPHLACHIHGLRLAHMFFAQRASLCSSRRYGLVGFPRCSVCLTTERTSAADVSLIPAVTFSGARHITSNT
jgi:hypothetical protein